MISDAPVDILNAVVKVSGRQAAKLQHDNPSYSGLITMKRKKRTLVCFHLFSCVCVTILHNIITLIVLTHQKYLLTCISKYISKFGVKRKNMVPISHWACII